VFKDEMTGAHVNRPALARCLKALETGDTLTVWKLDRLGRSLRNLIHMLDDFKQRGVKFRSLAELWADTATSTGRLMIAVLGRLADVERDLIRTRTAEGRSRAKARGQQMDRPPKLTPQQQKEARRRRAEGETLKELAKNYNVGKSTISRLAQ
jgi:DNA invertase Pin-like site-specific DNA recombinase